MNSPPCDAAHPLEEYDCPQSPRIRYLEDKDRDQNGKLTRIEKQVNRILWAMIGGLGAVVIALIAMIATMSG